MREAWLVAQEGGGVSKIRWDIVAAVAFFTPIVVIVMAILIHLMLWAITGDGSWAGYSPLDN